VVVVSPLLFPCSSGAKSGARLQIRVWSAVMSGCLVGRSTAACVFRNVCNIISPLSIRWFRLGFGLVVLDALYAAAAAGCFALAVFFALAAAATAFSSFLELRGLRVTVVHEFSELNLLLFAAAPRSRVKPHPSNEMSCYKLIRAQTSTSMSSGN